MFGVKLTQSPYRNTNYASLSERIAAAHMIAWPLLKQPIRSEPSAIAQT